MNASGRDRCLDVNGAALHLEEHGAGPSLMLARRARVQRRLEGLIPHLAHHGLRAVKSRYDADDLFGANHNIRPAA